MTYKVKWKVSGRNKSLMQLRCLRDKESKPGGRNCRLQRCRLSHVSLSVSLSFFFLKICYSLTVQCFWTPLGLAGGTRIPEVPWPCREPRLVAPHGKLMLPPTLPYQNLATQTQWWLSRPLCTLCDGCGTSRKPQLEAGCQHAAGPQCMCHITEVLRAVRVETGTALTTS